MTGMETVRYIPAINGTAELHELGKKIHTDDSLLLGEYGNLNPLSLFSFIRDISMGKKYLELILKNRNRELFDSFLCTAAAVGFDGAVIASGLFDRKSGMGKPVFDLDQAQALRRALSLRNEGRLAKGFILGIMSAAGNGAVRERAAFFLKEGADFIAIAEAAAGEEAAMKEFKDRICIIREL